MIVTLKYADSFIRNLAGYQSKNPASQAASITPVEEPKKFQEKDLFLDYYSAPPPASARFFTSPIDYTVKDWRLKEYEDLSPRIREVQEDIRRLAELRENILKSEDEVFSEVFSASEGLERKVRKQDLRAPLSVKCQLEKRDLLDCLKTGDECIDLLKAWKLCEANH